MHGEKDGIFFAEAGVVTSGLRVHVYDDVGSGSGVVPERQCTVLVQQRGYGLEIITVTN